MASFYTRRAFLWLAVGGITLATGLFGCAGQQAGVGAADPHASNIWTAEIVDGVGSSKQAAWATEATLDDGMCTIKAAMAIFFDQAISEQDSNSFTGSFDIWVSTKSDSKPHLHQSFEVLDQNGKSLFTLGPFGGFEVPSSSNYYHWIGYFNYPKASFAQMAKCCRLPSTCRE